MTHASYMHPTNLSGTINKLSYASTYFYFFFLMVISEVKNKPQSYL